MNPFLFSDDNKRYHTLSYYNRKNNLSAMKAVINAGFTCPNIDGSKGRGGCIYCGGGSGYFTAEPEIDIESQLDAELKRIRGKRPGANAIAYFQAHTNTYAPLDKLRTVFEAALSCEGVCGLSIATRADCLPSDVLDYLEELSRRTYLTVELGLQTVHDKTAELINRCHTFSEFREGFLALRERKIRTCVHLINGLPGESAEMMLESARILGELRSDAVKIHLLHVIRGTRLYEMYNRGFYDPMTLQSYIDIVVAQLEVLPPETVIERLTGDGDKRTLTVPLWSCDKIRVLGSIDKAMAERDTWQGKRLG